MVTKSALLKASIAGSLFLIGAQAYADVVQFKPRVGYHYVDSNENSVALDNVGNPVVTFSGNGKFTIQYAASCGVFYDNGAHMDIDIKVDGLPLLPTGGNDNDAFCSRYDNINGFAMNTASGRTVTLNAGTHTVEIRARIVGPANSYGYLAHSSLTILK